MQMTQAAAPNAIDENRHGQIGRPLDRVEGRLKVTGQALYAYEVQEGARPAYGWIVESSIPKGRLADVDTRAAEQAPGVLLVLTHRNMPPQAPYSMEVQQRFERPLPYLNDAEIAAYGEPVAFVVAESLEQARAAAALVRLDYAGAHGEYELRRHLERAEVPGGNMGEPDTAVGDFDGAFAQAPVTVDATYTTPFHIHAQMEPHATLAWWEGDRVVIHCSTQMVEHAQKRVANTLQMPPDKVRIVSRYIGGGFGGKLPVFADVILSAQAARLLGRPVKTALTRQQMFHITTHRSETVQRVRLGATRDGVLLAIGHQAWSHSARVDDFYETAAVQTRSLYAAAHRMTQHRVRKLDLPRADSCRAPGEAVGLLVLECAMDELAHQLRIDPVELRLRNEPTLDPEKGVPYSTRQLVPCLQEGARRFGWERRNPQPGQVREGRWLIGMGMCATTRSNHLQAAKCRVTLDREGVLTARMAMTDIGTGTYTILTQIGAEMLGLPPERVRILLGDSDFPPTAGSGGSFGAASSGSALYDACEKLRTKLAQSAGIDAAQAQFGDGKVTGGGKSAHLAALAHDGLSADGEIQPGDMDSRYSQQSYGAQFAEVAVDAQSGEVRLRRMLGVFAAGRILNLKTATSQAVGGMIWGVGSALHEEGALDARYGYFANHDLAEYHIPVHADIPAIEAVFLPELDDKANPLKIKGVGELGISGAGAAVANAIFNATGVRIRDYPMTLDKVLAGL
ncbi:MAG TPA: xanthine dehydrogenase family protein molybdopterin-binding subunit [Ramlibacter sp.]|jgi:xanthine dehydrogenase YagR molybdenum-binding subunit|uniref:xanthine dehydrogenase family protein molybdopterin-binding subunit n=1 Tax=Ramlibacter sp. TaxID=1917967 RepID=UPI002D69AE2E|nr:xanthine dehydrogenase family protein molybdopterin-binding subunit [Ramlibacter sp.]HZY18435.1 xanthine dehydrogenase family protein molybdopterin-binding subunit [Ramlibacter sp.]